MNTPATSIFVNRLHGLTRVAVTRNDRLMHLGLHADGDAGRPGDIYLGKVTRVIAGVNVAFLDLGGGMSAFLNRADIPKSLAKTREVDMAGVLKPGRVIPVQVSRAASGQKLATVTGELKLVGFSGILVVGGNGVSFSKRFKGERDKEAVAQWLGDAENVGYIVRSGAENMTVAQRAAEAASLLREWETVKTKIQEEGKPGLLRGLNPIRACLSDYWKDGLRSIFFDCETLHELWLETLQKEHPSLATAVKLHNDPFPMFDLYKIESEIKKAGSERVWLKTGGYFDVRHTEAMVTIDVNSGKDLKSGGGKGFMRANLEAAAEIGRQVRVRNLAGLVVVDFINGRGGAWRKQLDDALKKAFRGDPAKVDLLPVNHLGLAQLSRERLGPDLNTLLREKCGVCQGVGWVKTAEAAAYELELQLIRELGHGEGGRMEILCGRKLSRALDPVRIAAWEQRFQTQFEVKISDRQGQLSYELTLKE